MTEPAPEDRGGDEAPVARLPRGRMFKLSMPALVRIAMTLTLLVMLIVIQRPCADGVSRFVTGFGPGSGSDADGSAAVGSGSGSGSAALVVDPVQDYEPINADMTPAELEAAVQRARAKAKAPPPAVDAGVDSPDAR